jgi:2-desacetyl-2-hydroxyethyl bacteriochlorophyllide A dehydrogenase
MDRNGVSLLQRVAAETMQAGVLHGSRDVRFEAISRPAVGSGQVLLRVLRAGICGSDIHYYLHGYCGRFVPTRPFVLGHEFVATVAEIGDDVDSLFVGQRVAVNPAASCGHCEPCRTGRGNLCSRVVMLGSASTTPPTDGAFADYVVVPAQQCFALPESMPDCDAAMLEPLSVALHAIRRAGSVAGCRVLVSGGGPIGLLTARTARALGAARVVVSEPTEVRRKLAIELVADAVLDPRSEDFQKSAIAESGDGFDVVFEASGAAPAVLACLEVARRGATIVQIGTVGGNEVAIPVNDLMVRELSFLGTFRYANEFAEALRLVASGRINFEGFVTATIPIEDLSLALECAAGNPEALKVHVVND